MNYKKRLYNIQEGSILLITMLAISISFFSCSKEDNITNSGAPISSDLLNGKAEITARFCRDLYCNEFEILKGLEIELAIDTFVESGNRMLTDEDGKVIFSSLQKSAYIIKASYNDQLFIERFNVTRNGTSFHEIVFSPFCILDGNRLKDCDRNIRFDNLSVGQRNEYLLYKSIGPQNDGEKRFEYINDTLRLEVVERLEEDKWLIRETFKRPQEMPTNIFPWMSESILEYTFECTNGQLIINQEEFSSYLFYGAWNETYILDLKNYDLPRCEPVGWDSDCGDNLSFYITVESPQFLDLEFGGIFKNAIIFGGIDGPNTGLLYNENQGLIHMHYEHKYVTSEVYGFTKIK